MKSPPLETVDRSGWAPQHHHPGTVSMKRAGCCLVGAVLVAAASACERPIPYEPPPQSLGQAPTVPRVYRTVTIGDNFFNPIPLTITVGTRVFWVHQGLDQHTISFDPPIIFYSGLLNRTDQVQRQFNAPGTYTYHCDRHEGMRGIIDVRSQ